MFLKTFGFKAPHCWGVNLRSKEKNAATQRHGTRVRHGRPLNGQCLSISRNWQQKSVASCIGSCHGGATVGREYSFAHLKLTIVLS